MNSKKYLYDRLKDWCDLHGHIVGLLILLALILAFVLSCTVINKLYGHEVNYDSNNYEYLSEIVDSIWDEDTKSILVTKIPDDVYISDFCHDSDGITFNCYLKNGHMLTEQPYILVQISNDFETLTETHLSESEYVKNGAPRLWQLKILFFIASVVALFAVCAAFSFILWAMSSMHKSAKQKFNTE